MARHVLSKVKIKKLYDINKTYKKLFELKSDILNSLEKGGFEFRLCEGVWLGALGCHIIQIQAAFLALGLYCSGRVYQQARIVWIGTQYT